MKENTSCKMHASPRLVRYMIRNQVGQCVGTILTVIILLTQLVLSGTVVTIHTTVLSGAVVAICTTWSTYLPSTVFMQFVFTE